VTGRGALLIRETARRLGMRWSGILLLAMAYSVLEEGLVTQSLFNPDYVGEHLLEPANVSWLGTGLVWALYVLGLHVLGSIGVPVAMVEALAGDRRHTPWLRRRGLIVISGIFVAVPRRSQATTSASRRAPTPRTVGTVAFVLASADLAVPFVVDTLTPWGAVAVQVATVALATVLLVGWGRRAGWGPRSVLAVAVAVLAAYVWQGYKHVGLSAEGAVFGVGNILLDILVLRLARAAFRRTPAEAD
jgi:hypothetical protein